jgi:hypothetical protein
MNLAGWSVVIAIVSAAAGSGVAAALQLRERAASLQAFEPTRNLPATCMRSAAVAVARR